MFSTAAFANMIRKTYTMPEGNSPLLCWDIIQMYRAASTHLHRDLAGLKSIESNKKWFLSLDFGAILQNEFTIVITDIEQKIEWVSSSFQQMTGYSKGEAIGKNPNFLQGPNTDREQFAFLKVQIAARQKTATKVVNYRKNGNDYICQVEIIPMLNRKGELVNFLAIEKEVK
ncbi:PAS domain-containing protein [Runella sp.]|uniref:PAS domain-containing protein n=1 Tax=Runella sp. TaxID=1960881 RepID=UPI003D0D59B5